MKTPYNSYRPKNNGFTLIEVIASLMLVGTLLVAVLMAHRRTTQQTRLAQQRLTAITALDQLLTLRANPNEQEAGDLQQPTGKIPGSNPYHWRTIERNDPAAESFGAMILRIEVFNPEFEQGETLANVELLAPGQERWELSHARP